MKKKLEEELRIEFNKYNSKCHKEDMMSFIDYCYSIGTFKGYKIKVGFDDISFVK